MKKTTDGTVVSPAKVKLLKLNIGTKPVPKKVGGSTAGPVKPLIRKQSSATLIALQKKLSQSKLNGVPESGSTSLPKIESKNSSGNLDTKAVPESNGTPKLPPINGAA